MLEPVGTVRRVGSQASSSRWRAAEPRAQRVTERQQGAQDARRVTPSSQAEPVPELRQQAGRVERRPVGGAGQSFRARQLDTGAERAGRFVPGQRLQAHRAQALEHRPPRLRVAVAAAAARRSPAGRVARRVAPPRFRRAATSAPRRRAAVARRLRCLQGLATERGGELDPGLAITVVESLMATMNLLRARAIDVREGCAASVAEREAACLRCHAGAADAVRIGAGQQQADVVGVAIAPRAALRAAFAPAAPPLVPRPASPTSRWNISTARRCAPGRLDRRSRRRPTRHTQQFELVRTSASRRRAGRHRHRRHRHRRSRSRSDSSAASSAPSRPESATARLLQQVREARMRRMRASSRPCGVSRDW